MTAVTLVSPTTSADTSAKVALDPTQVPMMVFATGLAGAEAVTVKISPDDGTTPATLYQNGSAVTLTATNTAIVLDAPGTYSFAKSSTAGASGLYAARRDHF